MTPSEWFLVVGLALLWLSVSFVPPLGPPPDRISSNAPVMVIGIIMIAVGVIGWILAWSSASS